MLTKSADTILESWEIDSSLFENDSFIQTPLGDMIIESLYGTSEKSDYDNGTYKVIRIGNISYCDFDLSDIKKVELSQSDYLKYKLYENDFLIVRSNGNPRLVGKCAVWDKDKDFVFASYIIRFRFDTSRVLPHYVMYFLMSRSGRALLKPKTGGGTNNISATNNCKIQK